MSIGLFQCKMIGERTKAVEFNELSSVQLIIIK